VTWRAIARHPAPAPAPRELGASGPRGLGDRSQQARPGRLLAKVGMREIRAIRYRRSVRRSSVSASAKEVLLGFLWVIWDALGHVEAR